MPMEETTDTQRFRISNKLGVIVSILSLLPLNVLHGSSPPIFFRHSFPFLKKRSCPKHYGIVLITVFVHWNLLVPLEALSSPVAFAWPPSSKPDTTQLHPFRKPSHLSAATESPETGGDGNMDPSPLTYRQNLCSDIMHLPDVDRVLVLSDLHTDHVDNLAWLANRTAKGDLSSSDLLVVAGDISHDFERLEESFSLLLETGASVLFVAGNHEAWLSSAQLKRADATASVSSLDKLEGVYQHCQRMGVLTGCTIVGGTESRPHPLYILPLDSWYDGTLAIQECHDLVQDFSKWPWVDFMRCRWPFPGSDGRLLRKIPSGLVQFFAQYNQRLIHQMREAFEHSSRSNCSSIEKGKGKGIMTVSHFLPNQQCLPDWKDVSSNRFLKDSWLNHGGGGVSAKFALVAGTQELERQIRDLKLDPRGGESLRQIHVFGHSHRPKDFELDGIRYIHNPLGKPREREIFMVDPEVDFQYVWDTRVGEIEGETVIRYWEEKGGGVEMLRSRMKKSKRKSRYVFSQKGKTTTGSERKESFVSSSTGINVTLSSAGNN
ncbi:calcineurin-like phosphoesterase superfamily domain containing protein [Nitzschia inconspicua]|uniref:Calcineurin-like phosphoesterase superfamily domain containing protein n=1 Tax=Nitzschia inconspicua TaxID=303405 RepID=A0A9K3K6A5_9STRA|nr:calcineurin-like phosphoesterase superfamily domain containing protein [Nitzschia inconspicua]KAG7338454.1 calcineurin-like phosphoesterase superfamily domain containing protein [Nitzschia inconspicua]KAG7350752.1 calcineurin-like phosphoesterase superfamily domain containing protein [Nitzschia inconspicua]